MDKELFEFLNKELSEGTKRALSSTQTKELLDCVSKWVSFKIVQSEFARAKSFNDKLNRKQADVEDSKIEATFEEDFLDELSKL